MSVLQILDSGAGITPILELWRNDDISAGDMILNIIIFIRVCPSSTSHLSARCASLTAPEQESQGQPGHQDMTLTSLFPAKFPLAGQRGLRLPTKCAFPLNTLESQKLLLTYLPFAFLVSQ